MQDPSVVLFCTILLMTADVIQEVQRCENVDHVQIRVVDANEAMPMFDVQNISSPVVHKQPVKKPDSLPIRTSRETRAQNLQIVKTELMNSPCIKKYT